MQRAYFPICWRYYLMNRMRWFSKASECWPKLLARLIQKVRRDWAAPAHWTTTNSRAFVFADTTISQAHYRKFLLSLLNLFRDAKPFLDNRGAFIIRQLCTLLNAEFIFRIFAEIINEDDSNLKFSSTIVRTLNTILLTSSELFELRCLLRNINNEVIFISN